MCSLTVMHRIRPTSKSVTNSVDLARCLVLCVNKSAEICVPLILAIVHLFQKFSFISYEYAKQIICI